MVKKMLLYLVVGAAAAIIVLIIAVRALPAKRPDTLGLHDGRLAACPSSPNCVCSQDRDPGHTIDPIPFDGEPAEAMNRLKRAVAALPGTTIVTETPTYLHAESTSRLFRFTDDVECFIDSEAKVIHIRSASRIGHSDLNVNRKRMETLRAALK